VLLLEKLLTLVIPVYNTEKYLFRCLTSIIHSGIDVIFVNDGSTDNSKEIIDSFCEAYPNVKAIHTSNCGAARARVTGLKEVRTKYFGFVDSDDTIDVYKLFQLVCMMDAYGFKTGNGRMTVFLPDCKIPFQSRKWSKETLDFSFDKLEFSNLTCSLLDKVWHIDCASLFMFQSDQKVYEDLEAVYYVLAKMGKMLHTNDVLYHYRMRGLENNSTAAIGLQVTRSDALHGLLSASSSMIQKFKNVGLYTEFQEELEAIIIKLVYQRIFAF